MKLKIHPRETESLSIKIPKDTLASLKKVAANRDMPIQALLKLYTGQGLRQDISRFFGDQVLETTAQVLAKYIPSEERISSIIREIRSELIYKTSQE
jgi:hypothetical protein